MGTHWRDVRRMPNIGFGDGDECREGFQGNLDPQKNIIATVKHLYGGGASIGGVNHGNAEISERMAQCVSQTLQGCYRRRCDEHHAWT